MTLRSIASILTARRIDSASFMLKYFVWHSKEEEIIPEGTLPVHAQEAAVHPQLREEIAAEDLSPSRPRH